MRVAKEAISLVYLIVISLSVQNVRCKFNVYSSLEVNTVRITKREILYMQVLWNPGKHGLVMTGLEQLGPVRTGGG